MNGRVRRDLRSVERGEAAHQVAPVCLPPEEISASHVSTFSSSPSDRLMMQSASTKPTISFARTSASVWEERRAATALMSVL